MDLYPTTSASTFPCFQITYILQPAPALSILPGMVLERERFQANYSTNASTCMTTCMQRNSSSVTTGGKCLPVLVRGGRCIEPLVPENFEVSRRYFKPPLVCNMFQVNLHLGVLRIFYTVHVHWFLHQLKAKSFWQRVSANAMHVS